MRFASAVTAE